MADATPSRLGQQDSTGDDRALFLKVYAGEVLTAFAEKNVAMSRSMVRTISSGKSAQFPATGKTSASYHTPGNEISGQSINHNERVITIDDLLISDAFIAQIDEAMNHYDVRREYSTQAGRALARTMDNNLFQVGVLAARASATVSGLSGGSQVELAGSGGSYTASDLIDAAFSVSQKFDEKDVPEDDRFLFLSPADWNLLIQSGSDAIHQDFTEGRNGGVDTGMIRQVAGLRIVKTNHLPSTNVTSGPSAYQGDFSNTVALAWHRSAVGTVKLIDLATEMEYDIRRQGTLLVSKLAVGHGILRPESAVELKDAS